MSNFTWKIFSNFVSFSEYPNFMYVLSYSLNFLSLQLFKLFVQWRKVLSRTRKFYLLDGCSKNGFSVYRLYKQTKQFGIFNMLARGRPALESSHSFEMVHLLCFYRSHGSCRSCLSHIYQTVIRLS